MVVLATPDSFSTPSDNMTSALRELARNVTWGGRHRDSDRVVHKFKMYHPLEFREKTITKMKQNALWTKLKIEGCYCGH